MSSITIQSKLPSVGTTIFTIMSSLAVKHNAINLGQGFPDFPMNSELIRLVNEAMKAGHNQYTHMNGYPPLREALAAKVQSSYQTHIDPETDITITPGGTYALFTAMTAILRPGDEVIVFEPAYDSYIPSVELCGAIAVTIPLQFPQYRINWELVKTKLTARTRMIIINSPHNPTGAVLKKEDMSQLAALVEGTNIIILSDEVYEHIIFDGMEHESIIKYPTLFERSFVCFSFGKVYHSTGWKIGYCISSKSLMAEFRKVHQFNCFSVDTPKQVALSKFLSHAEHYTGLGSFLQRKRDHFQQLMTHTKLKPLPSNGSYFQIYTYEGLSDKTEQEFATWLTVNYGVAAIPVSAFYQEETNNKALRFCFVKQESTLEAAVNRLQKL